ncbi:MFS transporter [Erythrobacter sp. HKB08]|uniref:MFS transporter n=1 Tax=Erythrobacter sp. HKB08 TaxID=2502843 RepID=UPI00100873F0|nr:MFS transporter [Erythrobacter sp. HKB08]
MADADARQSTRFLLLYGLAFAGGAVAYVPFLTILLPLRIKEISGIADVEWLALVTFGGAVAASLANIGFGWASDRTRDRRIWVWAGMILSSLLLVGVSQAQSLELLIGAVFLWQLALNMMLAPLAAWAGDCVPDEQKGMLGGLLAFAPAFGAMTGAIITIPGLAGPDARLVIIAIAVVALVTPALVFGRPKPMPHLTEPTLADQAGEDSSDKVQTILRMWVARLLVQIAEAALFAYLLFWLLSLSPQVTDNDTARLFGFVLLAAIPLAFLAGVYADRTGHPIRPLAIASFVAATGLGVMLLAPGITVGIAGYVIFSVAASVFLAQHSSQVLRVLPKPQSRGRDLGLFNLTNTVPSLIMPWLALGIIPRFGYSGLFAVLAVFALIAGILLATARRPA